MLVDLVDLHQAQHAVLVKLGLGKGQRESAGVHRRIHLSQNVRQSAEMVLVAVRDEEAQQVVLTLDEVADVGQHQVDPGHLVAREG